MAEVKLSMEEYHNVVKNLYTLIEKLYEMTKKCNDYKRQRDEPINDIADIKRKAEAFDEILKMRFNNRKNEEYCSLYDCPVCGKEIVRPTGEGNRLTACSQSCSQLGKARGTYKPYIYINEYKYIYNPKHPNSFKSGYIAEHRLIAEKIVGRYLNKNEIVHHINDDKTDNRIENLEIMSASEHNKTHSNKRSRDQYGKYIV